MTKESRTVQLTCSLHTQTHNLVRAARANRDWLYPQYIHDIEKLFNSLKKDLESKTCPPT